MAKKAREKKPTLNPRLQGFDIRINSFGEIVPDWDLSRLNEFLDEHVPDKKLLDRPDHVNRRAVDVGEKPVTDSPKGVNGTRDGVDSTGNAGAAADAGGRKAAKSSRRGG